LQESNLRGSGCRYLALDILASGHRTSAATVRADVSTAATRDRTERKGTGFVGGRPESVDHLEEMSCQIELEIMLRALGNLSLGSLVNAAGLLAKSTFAHAGGALQVCGVPVSGILASFGFSRAGHGHLSVGHTANVFDLPSVITNFRRGKRARVLLPTRSWKSFCSS
jgi:hypothetical protein